MSERDWQKDWEMCERATFGKWEMVSANCPEGPYMIRMPYPKGGTWYGVRMIAWKKDAEFIAEAREALPYWLQRVWELEDENRELRDVLETLVKNSVSPFKNGEPDCGQYDGYFNGLKKAREILGRTRLEVEK